MRVDGMWFCRHGCQRRLSGPHVTHAARRSGPSPARPPDRV